MNRTNVTIEALYIYPVKSLQGCASDNIGLVTGGLLNDRQWAIFKADGGMLTQRAEPKMARLQVELLSAGIRLSADSGATITVNETELDTQIEVFEIWSDCCPARRASEKVGQWLTEVLQSSTPLILAKVENSQARQFNHPERFDTQANYFSDAAPLLVCNLASLKAINQELKNKGLAPIDMRHFRPNIVISGIEAFSEHRFQSLSIDDQEIIRLVDHCQRCSVITVNPDTGTLLEKGYPLSTLMRLNTMPGASKAPAFGVNASVGDAGLGSTLRLGQKLVLN